MAVAHEVVQHAVRLNPQLGTTPRPEPIAPSGEPGSMRLVGSPLRSVLAVTNPDPGQRVLLELSSLVLALALGAAAVVLLRLLRTVRTADGPFVVANARRLALIGVCLLVGAAVPLVDVNAVRLVVRGTPVQDAGIYSASDAHWMIAASFAAFALAEVFRQGTKVRYVVPATDDEVAAAGDERAADDAEGPDEGRDRDGVAGGPAKD
jgi:hypothetical protein